METRKLTEKEEEAIKAIESALAAYRHRAQELDRVPERCHPADFERFMEQHDRAQAAVWWAVVDLLALLLNVERDVITDALL